jgi:hypothetical protein
MKQDRSTARKICPSTQLRQTHGILQSTATRYRPVSINRTYRARQVLTLSHFRLNQVSQISSLIISGSRRTETQFRGLRRVHQLRFITPYVITAKVLESSTQTVISRVNMSVMRLLNWNLQRSKTVFLAHSIPMTFLPVPMSTASKPTTIQYTDK